jgi:hypothetical protein
MPKNPKLSLTQEEPNFTNNALLVRGFPPKLGFSLHVLVPNTVDMCYLGKT